MNTFSRSRWILALAALFALLGPGVRGEQPKKPLPPTPEERIKKLEDRADAAEKAAATAAMEKDYIVRTQKLYESYYQRTLITQLWTLGIVVLLLTVVFVFVARFSLNLFEQRTKLAITDASAQLRNEYARTLGKEIQKLWESNAADNRKLKEALSSQTAELERNLKDRTDFHMYFLQGLAAVSEERHDDCVAAFRHALAAYKSSKPRNLIETKTGAMTARYIFESLRKKHGENSTEKAREELADALYNDLEEELALAALHSPWLAPLIKERNPALQAEPPQPEPASEARPVLPAPQAPPIGPESEIGEQYDSCRLISN